MEVSQLKSENLLVVSLVGRLDAGWCDPVETVLLGAIRSGEHRIHVDMSKVDYMSSTGISVLLASFKQLSAINGTFGVIDPSPGVRTVLELSGLKILIAEREVAAAVATKISEGTLSSSANATYELFTQPTANPLTVERIGSPDWIRQTAPAKKISFGNSHFALGIGALGSENSDCATRFGEFLAIAGVAAFQPTDGSSRPDFIVREGAMVPEGCLLSGFAGTGSFPLLARFEAAKGVTSVPLRELAGKALELSGTDMAVIVGITETAGLIGATLQKTPQSSASADPLVFPEIRDWISFTSERAFRDSTSLLVGVVSREPDPLLRSWGSRLYAHFHAASFPYRPLQKGLIDLPSSVHSLFEAHGLQSVLHLLADPREFNGAGESEFFRGALWIAPATGAELKQP